MDDDLYSTQKTMREKEEEGVVEEEKTKDTWISIALRQLHQLKWIPEN